MVLICKMSKGKGKGKQKSQSSSAPLPVLVELKNTAKDEHFAHLDGEPWENFPRPFLDKISECTPANWGAIVFHHVKGAVMTDELVRDPSCPDVTFDRMAKDKETRDSWFPGHVNPIDAFYKDSVYRTLTTSLGVGNVEKAYRTALAQDPLAFEDARSRLVTLSKSLGWLLRHQEGAEFRDPKGWINLDLIALKLDRPWQKLSVQDLLLTILFNNKGRSQLAVVNYNTTKTPKMDKVLVYVRFYQGHTRGGALTLASTGQAITRQTLNENPALAATVAENFWVHCTKPKAAHLIAESGNLKAGGNAGDRLANHFGPIPKDLNADVKAVRSGCHVDKPVWYFLDIEKVLDQRLGLVLTGNNCILAEEDIPVSSMNAVHLISNSAFPQRRAIPRAFQGIVAKYRHLAVEADERRKERYAAEAAVEANKSQASDGGVGLVPSPHAHGSSSASGASPPVSSATSLSQGKALRAPAAATASQAATGESAASQASDREAGRQVHDTNPRKTSSTSLSQSVEDTSVEGMLRDALPGLVEASVEQLGQAVAGHLSSGKDGKNRIGLQLQEIAQMVHDEFTTDAVLREEELGKKAEAMSFDNSTRAVVPLSSLRRDNARGSEARKKESSQPSSSVADVSLPPAEKQSATTSKLEYNCFGWYDRYDIRSEANKRQTPAKILLDKDHADIVGFDTGEHLNVIGTIPEVEYSLFRLSIGMKYYTVGDVPWDTLAQNVIDDIKCDKICIQDMTSPETYYDQSIFKLPKLEMMRGHLVISMGLKHENGEANLYPEGGDELLQRLMLLSPDAAERHYEQVKRFTFRLIWRYKAAKDEFFSNTSLSGEQNRMPNEPGRHPWVDRSVQLLIANYEDELARWCWWFFTCVAWQSVPLNYRCAWDGETLTVSHALHLGVLLIFRLYELGDLVSLDYMMEAFYVWNTIRACEHEGSGLDKGLCVTFFKDVQPRKLGLPTYQSATDIVGPWHVVPFIGSPANRTVNDGVVGKPESDSAPRMGPPAIHDAVRQNPAEQGRTSRWGKLGETAPQRGVRSTQAQQHARNLRAAGVVQAFQANLRYPPAETQTHTTSLSQSASSTTGQSAWANFQPTGQGLDIQDNVRLASGERRGRVITHTQLTQYRQWAYTCHSKISFSNEQIFNFFANQGDGRADFLKLHNLETPEKLVRFLEILNKSDLVAQFKGTTQTLCSVMRQTVATEVRTQQHKDVHHSLSLAEGEKDSYQEKCWEAMQSNLAVNEVQITGIKGFLFADGPNGPGYISVMNWLAGSGSHIVLVYDFQPPEDLERMRIELRLQKNEGGKKGRRLFTTDDGNAVIVNFDFACSLEPLTLNYFSGIEAKTYQLVFLPRPRGIDSADDHYDELRRSADQQAYDDKCDIPLVADKESFVFTFIKVDEEYNLSEVQDALSELIHDAVTEGKVDIIFGNVGHFIQLTDTQWERYQNALYDVQQRERDAPDPILWSELWARVTHILEAHNSDRAFSERTAATIYSSSFRPDDGKVLEAVGDRAAQTAALWNQGATALIVLHNNSAGTASEVIRTSTFANVYAYREWAQAEYVKGSSKAKAKGIYLMNPDYTSNFIISSQEKWALLEDIVSLQGSDTEFLTALEETVPCDYTIRQVRAAMAETEGCISSSIAGSTWDRPIIVRIKPLTHRNRFQLTSSGFKTKAVKRALAENALAAVQNRPSKAPALSRAADEVAAPSAGATTPAQPTGTASLSNSVEELEASMSSLTVTTLLPMPISAERKRKHPDEEKAVRTSSRPQVTIGDICDWWQCHTPDRIPTLDSDLVPSSVATLEYMEPSVTQKQYVAGKGLPTRVVNTPGGPLRLRPMYDTWSEQNLDSSASLSKSQVSSSTPKVRRVEPPAPQVPKVTPPDGAHVPMPARASLVKGSVGPYLQPVPLHSGNESQSSQASTVPPIAASVSLNSGVSDWLGEESDVPTVFHRRQRFALHMLLVHFTNVNLLRRQDMDVVDTILTFSPKTVEAMMQSEDSLRQGLQRAALVFQQGGAQPLKFVGESGSETDELTVSAVFPWFWSRNLNCGLCTKCGYLACTRQENFCMHDATQLVLAPGPDTGDVRTTPREAPPRRSKSSKIRH